MIQPDSVDKALFLRLVGRRVATFREAQGMSQQALAGAVGLSAADLASLERGEASLDATRLQGIAMALGLSLRALLPDLDEMSRA